MNWVRVVLAAPLLLSALAAEPRARQEPAPSAPPAAADLVLVEAEVVDGNGRPVPGLTPDQFDVTISGRVRRVVSAEFVDAAKANAVALPGPEAAGGRLFFVAVDLTGFVALESVAICIAAQSFVDNLLPNDRVGVVTYPAGVVLDPTTDRAAIRKALETIVVVPGAATTGPQQDYKPRTGLEAFRGVISRLSTPERKFVVLFSPGIPGAPEDVGDLTMQVSQQAAASNVTIYGVFVDRSFIDLTIAEKDRIAMVSPTRAVPINGLTRWLDRMATPSGGAVFQVNGINPEPLLARMTNEMSGYYALGVDGADLDRGTTPRELGVKVKLAGVSVRARNWVLTSRRIGGTAPAPATAIAASTPATPAARPGRPTTDPVLLAFERGEYSTMQERLTRLPALAKWINDFRGGARPWPEAPRRALVVALDVAAAALSTTDGAAREEAVKLLLEQSATIRPAQANDPFDCAWFWAALMIFEGSDHPEDSVPLVSRATSRCPAHPRITLARAVLVDQASPVLAGSIRVGVAADAEARAHKAVIEAYQAAMRFSETEAEARVRLAWFFLRLKRFGEAIGLLAEAASPVPIAPTLEEAYRRQAQTVTPFDYSIERQVRYFGHLVEGHALRAQGQTAPAATAYRQAMDAWPGAQAARLSLMTLLGIQGRTEEASALANAIESAPEDTSDPWWWFWQGDRVFYPALMLNLRESVR